MFCGNCGKSVKEGRFFCVYCGNKQAAEEPVKQVHQSAMDIGNVMFSVSIGYIIELDEEKGTAQIETGRGNVFLEKSDYEFRHKTGFYNQNVTKEEIYKCKELQEKGVFSFAGTIEDLFSRIKGLFPVRQGICFKKEERIFIFCGEGPKEVAEIQRYVWQNADSKHTLGEIFTMFNTTKVLNTRDSIQDFIESVVGLVRLGAMFLRV